MRLNVDDFIPNFRRIFSIIIQMKPENLEKLEKTYQLTTKIVLIQIFFAIILMVTGWFVSSNVDNSVSPNAVIALWTIFFAVVICSLILGRVLFNWQRLKKIFAKEGRQGALKSLQQNTVILFAFGQVIVLTGFLIATLTVNKIEILRTGAVALVIFWFHFPRKPIWEKIISSLEKA